MRIEPAEITLGSQSFTIRPLSLSQVQRLEQILTDPVLGKLGVGLAVNVVMLGLSRDNPDLRADDLEASLSELQAAMDAVLLQGGFTPTKKDDDLGEAPAAAGSARTSGSISAGA